MVLHGVHFRQKTFEGFGEGCSWDGLASDWLGGCFGTMRACFGDILLGQIREMFG